MKKWIAAQVAKMERIRFVDGGFWFWAIVATALSGTCLVFLSLAAYYMDLKGQFRPDTPPIVAGVFYVLRECGAFVGGILGLSALAWAHFFRASIGDGHGGL